MAWYLLWVWVGLAQAGATILLASGFLVWGLLTQAIASFSLWFLGTVMGYSAAMDDAALKRYAKMKEGG